MGTILFSTESHYPVDRKIVKKAVEEYLKNKLKGKWEVGVTIIGDRKMRFLNRTYRKKDSTTDVLSFCLNETSPETVPFVNPPDKVLRLGDVVVSYPQAIADASREGKLVDDMIVTLVLHGLNHLMGIHHE